MQRYFGIKKDNNRLYLNDSDYHHIKNVMRMSDGDLVEVVIDNRLYLGCIENVKSNVSILIKKELLFERSCVFKMSKKTTAGRTLEEIQKEEMIPATSDLLLLRDLKEQQLLIEVLQSKIKKLEEKSNGTNS